MAYMEKMRYSMTTYLTIIFFGMFQDAIVTPVGYHVFGQTRSMVHPRNREGLITMVFEPLIDRFDRACPHIYIYIYIYMGYNML